MARFVRFRSIFHDPELSFNLGVELGQLLVLALMIPALELLFRFVVDERMGTIILSALVAHTAWHWMIERGERLRRYPRPALDLLTLVIAMRWLMLIVVVAGLVWLAFGALRRPGAAAGNEAFAERNSGTDSCRVWIWRARSGSVSDDETFDSSSLVMKSSRTRSSSKRFVAAASSSCRAARRAAGADLRRCWSRSTSF